MTEGHVGTAEEAWIASPDAKAERHARPTQRMKRTRNKLRLR